jgi:hypothetical protein
VVNDRLKQRGEIGERRVEIERRGTVARRGVDDGRVELRVIGLQLDEEVEHLIVDAHGVGARAIDLVDDDDRSPAQSESLPEHESRLRHGSIERVDDEQHAVNHAKDALYLAAEVGVAGRVDNIDLDATPSHRRILGQDRDAPLALERVRIHHALLNHLILAKGAGLAQQFVDEGGLAVIDVRNDGDVANLHRLIKISGLLSRLQARQVNGTDGAAFVRMSHSLEVRHGTA